MANFLVGVWGRDGLVVEQVYLRRFFISFYFGEEKIFVQRLEAKLEIVG
jgi:hypothetical protein